MAFGEPPTVTARSPYEVSVLLRGRPRSAVWRVVSGTVRTEVTATFTAIGGSLALASVSSPIAFHVVFTGRPDRAGGCITQTVFLFRTFPGVQWVRGLALMATLLHDDRRILDTLQFRPEFAERDAPLRAFADAVNRLGSW